MSQQALLKRVTAFLGRAGIAYMVTGSVVSSMQGEPRATHDIDLVVRITPSAVGSLMAAFPPPDFYLDQEAVLAAIDQRSMFNLIELREGDKVDFWLLTDEIFDQSRFARRQMWDLDGEAIAVSQAEDTILMKLRWAQMSGGSEKQFVDALRVYEVQFNHLDINYLREWVDKLGIRDLWVRLEKEAQIIV